MTTKQEMIDICTREGDPESAALFAAMTDDEYAAHHARGKDIADLFEKDPLMRLDLEYSIEYKRSLIDEMAGDDAELRAHLEAMPEDAFRKFLRIALHRGDPEAFPHPDDEDI